MKTNASRLTNKKIEGFKIIISRVNLSLMKIIVILVLTIVIRAKTENI